jgi:DNA adenine methylase
MKPIIKWAGGKRKLLPLLRESLPKEGFDRYIEPFFGGGALLFDLMPKNAYVCDSNSELINMYRQVRDYPVLVGEGLLRLENTLECYTKMREMDRKDIMEHSPVSRAVRFIFLNKTCFNGLYRVNPHGHFNVPFGHPDKLSLPSLVELIEMSDYLKSGKIYLNCLDFEFIDDDGSLHCEYREGDFVYFDPPYIPVSESRSFVGYTAGGFGIHQHIRLMELCRRLDRSGIKFMLSNSYSTITMDLYGHDPNFKIEIVSSSRSIGRRGDSRKKIKEIIVRNYQ